MFDGVSLAACQTAYMMFIIGAGVAGFFLVLFLFIDKT